MKAPEHLVFGNHRSPAQATVRVAHCLPAWYERPSDPQNVDRKAPPREDLDDSEACPWASPCLSGPRPMLHPNETSCLSPAGRQYADWPFPHWPPASCLMAWIVVVRRCHTGELAVRSSDRWLSWRLRPVRLARDNRRRSQEVISAQISRPSTSADCSGVVWVVRPHHDRATLHTRTHVTSSMLRSNLDSDRESLRERSSWTETGDVVAGHK